MTPEYCRLMARYNAWQNDELRRSVEGVPSDVLDADRGAFFGSIRETLNHLLWADLLWMNRFDGGPGPTVDAADHTKITVNMPAWWADRFRTDGRIQLWAEELKALDLVGDLVWYAPIAGREMHKPIAPCIVGFFNHQTHHRGQVHAMLTAAGHTTDDTDLILMPED